MYFDLEVSGSSLKLNSIYITFGNKSVIISFFKRTISGNKKYTDLYSKAF